MNQLELKANTWSWRQARENACEQVTIGFILCLFFSQSQSAVIPKPKKSRNYFLHSIENRSMT